MTACQAKSSKKDKSCLRNLIQCCCSRGSPKKSEVETVQIYQSSKNPFESDFSLLTQGSCDEHALNPKTLSATSQTDGSYPTVATTGDQAKVKSHIGDVVVNYCRTTASDIKLKPNIKLNDCPSLTDDMIKKDNQELVEMILAKYLEYKYQESLIKQQIMEEQQAATNKREDYYHEEEKLHSCNFPAIDSRDQSSEGKIQEKSNAASSDCVELPEKSKSEPTNYENCMYSDAISVHETSKSDSHIMLNDESQNKKLELVFLPSSSSEILGCEAVSELDSSKSIQYKISCPDHEQSYTVGCMKETDNIQQKCDEAQSKTIAESDSGDFHHTATPSVVKWKLIISSHPDNGPPASPPDS